MPPLVRCGVFAASFWIARTYIGDSDAKDQSENNITAHVLVLDPKSFCLQSANGDCESKNEVEEDQRGVGVADDLEGSPELQHCQCYPDLRIARRVEFSALKTRVLLTCSGATGAMVVCIWSELWVDTISRRSCVASYRTGLIS